MAARPGYFASKHQALGYLWAWGLANVGLGVVLTGITNGVVRHLGLQALTWGAIDAALAWFGRRDARQAGQRGDNPEPAARRDTLILAVNIGLDAGYLASAWLLLRRARHQPSRVGAALGIAVQGLFLLIYDSALVSTLR